MIFCSLGLVPGPHVARPHIGQNGPKRVQFPIIFEYQPTKSFMDQHIGVAMTIALPRNRHECMRVGAAQRGAEDPLKRAEPLRGSAAAPPILYVGP